MNKEQLETIKERVAKATPGEWSIECGAVITKHPDFQGVSDGVFGLHSAVCYTNDGEYIENSNAIHDSRFIAHARQDVPALIETVEKLMNVRDVSYAEYAELDAKNKELKEQRNALKFHLKVSSKALESEGAKADKFQIALEKIYDDIGILTSQEIYRIVEDALEGTTALGGDEND